MARNLMAGRPPIYDPEAVIPMRDELKAVGFEELLTPEDVDQAIQNNTGTLLVVINSVCGCAAGSARPGVALALQHTTIPDRLMTVFAGMERDAVDRLREYLVGYPPSSPFMVIFEGDKPVFVLQRMDIEGHTPQEIAADLASAFEKYCSKPGPSISPETFEELGFARFCGSKIPKFVA